MKIFFHMSFTWSLIGKGVCVSPVALKPRLNRILWLKLCVKGNCCLQKNCHHRRLQSVWQIQTQIHLIVSFLFSVILTFVSETTKVSLFFYELNRFFLSFLRKSFTCFNPCEQHGQQQLILNASIHLWWQFWQTYY